MNRRYFTLSLYPIFCLFVAMLCSCSGYTPQGRLATRDEALTFFFNHKKEFESLRDMMISEKANMLTVYDTGDYGMYDDNGKPPLKTRVLLYKAKLIKLGLPNVAKSFIDPKYPIVDITVSAKGLVGDGPSVKIYFTKGRPYPSQGGSSKITADGWYMTSD